MLCCCSSHPAFGISGWLRLPIIPSTPARAPLKFSTKVTNDEDGMPMRGARLHSYRRPGGACNKVGRFTRPWSFQPSSPVLKSARNHSHSINESLIHQMPLLHYYSDGHHVFCLSILNAAQFLDCNIGNDWCQLKFGITIWLFVCLRLW